MDEARIYLDNAATSWPKPNAVYETVDRYFRENGAPAGRSVYSEAQWVEREIGAARQLAAWALGDVAPSSLVFTSNGTDSLNQAIHGILRPGDHVVASLLEHNSVLRPLRYLEQHGVSVTRLACPSNTVIDVDQLFASITNKTRLIVVTHMSNVTGAIQDVEEICRRAAQRELPCLVDAAQSAGHLELPFARLPNTMVATPAHKGLLGPLGLGLLSIPESLQRQLVPLRQGGTGTKSELDEQPLSMPDRFESGNHNVPAILGLAAGIRYLQEQGLERVQSRLEARRDELLNGLMGIDGVTLFGPASQANSPGRGGIERQGPVISFTVQEFEPQEVAAMLDSGHRVQARAGYLCAPLVHALIGAEQGGVVRFSPGVFTTSNEIQVAIRAVEEIAAAAIFD